MEAMRVEDEVHGAGEWWGWDEQRALTQWGGAELAARGSVWRGPSARSVECTTAGRESLPHHPSTRGEKVYLIYTSDRLRTAIAS